MSRVKRSKHTSEEMSSSSCSSSSLTSDEEADAQDLKPIKGYLSNRRELAKQLFKSVKPEKIRMMLPQALKRVNLSELEEWCVSELSGMSKTRILCILNGKPMDDSSETSESDNSGPSLEIISDTEEWFTDEDINKKEDGFGAGHAKSRKGKVKVKNKLQTAGDADKFKLKGKINTKERPDVKLKDVKVKTENENNKSKEKEGDSLLDLLELEMRARAIRALIRKEEDIIPNPDGSKPIKHDQPLNKNGANSAIQDDQKEKENCRRQIEKIISAQHVTNEDEDVVLVVQPTPTIELLSSDSDSESHNTLRINKRLENERTALDGDKLDDREIRTSSQKVAKAVVNKEKEDVNGKQDGCSHILTTDQSKHGVEKKRKSNKRSHAKDQPKSTKQAENVILKSCKGDTHGDTRLSENVEHTSAQNDAAMLKPIKTAGNDQPKDNGQLKVPRPTSTLIIEEEKSIDMDEIIDLDDYSDNIEDIEDCGSNKSKQQKVEVKEDNVLKEIAQPQKPTSTETWASRYYQTDDVQSVIKESKIQSEIRKRLRERQRLSKLNKPPSTSSPTSSSLPETTPDTPSQKPTGSVDEYLALKRSGSINTNPENDNTNSNMSEEKSQPFDSCSDVDTTNTTGFSVETKEDTKQVSTSSDVDGQSCAEAIEVNNKTNPT